MMTQEELDQLDPWVVPERGLTTKQFQQRRKIVAARLDSWLEGRMIVFVGVSEKTPFMNGTDNGSLHPGKAYRLTAEEFKAIKLSPERSSKVLCLEPKRPHMFWEVQQALYEMYPNARRQVLLANA